MAHFRQDRLIASHEWDVELDRLVGWFRIKNMTAAQSDAMYRRLQSYPLVALRQAIDKLIEERRPTPGNWPTINEIINGCQEWLSAHPDEKFKMYDFDKEDDPDYPVTKLSEGYGVLTKFGPEAFASFCKANRMPRQDVERVKNKLRVVNAREKAARLVRGVAERRAT